PPFSEHSALVARRRRRIASASFTRKQFKGANCIQSPGVEEVIQVRRKTLPIPNHPGHSPVRSAGRTRTVARAGIGMTLVTVLLLATFVRDVSAVVNGLVPAIRTLTSLIYLLASVGVTVFLLAFYKSKLWPARREFVAQVRRNTPMRRDRCASR